MRLLIALSTTSCVPSCSLSHTRDVRKRTIRPCPIFAATDLLLQLHQPLGKYADDFVIEIVPPDVVFTPPPKPAPPLPAQTQLPSLTKHGDAFGPSSRLNSSVLLIGAVGLAACTMLWLEYRGAVARRGAFYLTMERLAESLKPSLWHPDPASGQHAGVRACDGTLKERMDEAARRVSVLQREFLIVILRICVVGVLISLFHPLQIWQFIFRAFKYNDSLPSNAHVFFCVLTRRGIHCTCFFLPRRCWLH